MRVCLPESSNTRRLADTSKRCPTGPLSAIGIWSKSPSTTTPDKTDKWLFNTIIIYCYTSRSYTKPRTVTKKCRFLMKKFCKSFLKTFGRTKFRFETLHFYFRLISKTNRITRLRTHKKTLHVQCATHNSNYARILTNPDTELWK